MKGFIEFIKEQGVVGIGVAFVLGAAVTKLVGSFVTNLVNPILSVLLGMGGGLSNATLKVWKVRFQYGNFISALIDFMIVALVVYLFVKVLRLEKLDKKKDK